MPSLISHKYGFDKANIKKTPVMFHVKLKLKYNKYKNNIITTN